MGCYLHGWHLQFKFGGEAAWFGVVLGLLFARATNEPGKLIDSAWIWNNADLGLQWRQEFTLEGEGIGLTEDVMSYSQLYLSASLPNCYIGLS